MATAVTAPAPLGCQLAAEPPLLAGGPARVRLTLTNEGTDDLHALVWNTPFEEGWLGTPFTVTRDGVELPYGGALVKRGDPDIEEYLTVAAGESASAVADLAEVYPLEAAGTYEIRWVASLADVAAGAVALPRPRAEHQPAALACGPLRLELAPH